MKEVAAVTRGPVAFVFVLLLAACQPTGLSTVSTPTASVAPEDDPSLTPVPAGRPATPPVSGDFVPPAPACPAPVDPVTTPDVTVSVGDGPPIAATPGASTLVTCSMTMASDTVGGGEPPDGLSAHPGDSLRLSLPDGWHLLHWEGFDRPEVGEGGNVWPGVDTPDRPGQIDVPVPIRSGDSIAGYTLWVISADGRVVGQIEVSVRVSID